MHTILLRLAGPMQSWGTRSRFTERDTELEPSKSGVLGLLCAALGIDRSVWDKPLQPCKFTLEQLSKLRMGVRVDREGILQREFQTAGMAFGGQDRVGIRRADGGLEKKDVACSNRYYLADAVFLVGLEGEDADLLTSVFESLNNPTWPLFLGRKSYVPSPEVYLPVGVGVPDGLRPNEDLETALVNYPFLPALELREIVKGSFKYVINDEALSDGTCRCMIEVKSDERQVGSPRMDVPTDSFLERKFGRRYVKPCHIDLKNREVSYAPF